MEIEQTVGRRSVIAVGVGGAAVSLLGIDPMPNRLPHYLRMLLIFITLPFHAFLGVTIMGSTRLIAEEWYLAFERSWGLSPMEDQSWAGGLMWATGDITMFAAMITIFIQWIQDSNREAKRVDRALDREEAQRARQAGLGYDSVHVCPPGGKSKFGGCLSSAARCL